jgi:hypothetical protein
MVYFNLINNQICLSLLWERLSSRESVTIQEGGSRLESRSHVLLLSIVEIPRCLIAKVFLRDIKFMTN